jgi:plastocyanin
MNESTQHSSGTTSRARRASGAVVAALFAFGAILLLGSPAQAHGGHHITIKQYMFMPMAETIAQGDTMTWTNQDSVGHNVVVTSGPASFASPMLAQGQSWSHTFTVAGLYSYICSVHPDMRASLSVTATSVASVQASPAGAGLLSKSSKPVAGAVPKNSAAQAMVGHPTTAPATVAAPAVKTTPSLVAAPQSEATLQPLLLVVGASVAAVVFCLLLMASRPVVVGADGSPEEGPVPPKHLDGV